MYRSHFASISLVAALALAVPATLAQDAGAEDATRGAFLKHRPERASSTKPNPDPKPNGHSRPEPSKGKGGGATVAAATPSDGRAIGLGYTIFKQGEKGMPIRTDPKQIFLTGQKIRFMLETNVDGYLYIFNTENDGPASLIFPDPRLNGGSNRLMAHTPIEIPSRREKDSEARWFEFRASASAEKVYFVVTRTPMPGVPSDRELATYYATYDTYWSPPLPVWEATVRGRGVKVDESLLARYGQVQTAEETGALTRSIGLSKKAAQPTVVRVNALADSDIHVTVVDLIHK